MRIFPQAYYTFNTCGTTMIAIVILDVIRRCHDIVWWCHIASCGIGIGTPYRFRSACGIVVSGIAATDSIILTLTANICAYAVAM